MVGDTVRVDTLVMVRVDVGVLDGILVLVRVAVGVLVAVGVMIVRYAAGIHPTLPSGSRTSTHISPFTTSMP